MKKSLDPHRLKAVFVINGQEMDVSLQGLDDKTIYHLALIGAHELLNKRKDPAKTWKEIRGGVLVKQKSYKPVIHAISKVMQSSLADAEEYYSLLNQKEKMQLREDTRIKAELLKFEPIKEFDFSTPAAIAETLHIPDPQ